LLLYPPECRFHRPQAIPIIGEAAAGGEAQDVGLWPARDDYAMVCRVSLPVIQVSGLRKSFGDTRAVDGIDFVVPRAATAALLGGNGAGKTTTLSMLLGLLLPTAGRIRIFGEDMLRHRYRVLPRMNFSSPYVDLPHRLTVRQNLKVYGRLYALAQVDRRIESLASDLQIGDFLDRQTGQLSAGQKTRVALAKALLNEPELLLLDEPTASLDPDTGDWVRSYLETYQRRSGATILLASHNMGEVERLCSEVMMMRQGRIVDRGSPRELILRYGRDTLEQVFLDIARAGTRFDATAAAQ
jgi:ABC-2 type transport system ATP-binding protein